MATLTLHLLAGDADVLLPEPLSGTELARLWGSDLRCATADWLAPGRGHEGHGFLLDHQEDDRLRIFARGLVTDYVRGPRPLLICPTLADAPWVQVAGGTSSWEDVLQRLQHAISSFGLACRFHLHLLTDPKRTDGESRLKDLQVWMEGRGLCAQIDTNAVLSWQPQTSLAALLERNAQCSQLTTALLRRCTKRGLTVTDPYRLAKYLSGCLRRWEEIGLALHVPPEEALLDHLADNLITAPSGPLSDGSIA